MQKPQCTQARRILSASAMSGSASWARLKFGLHATTPRVMPAAVEHALRDRNSGAPARSSAATPAGCGWNTSTSRAHVFGGTEQRGVAAGGIDARAHQGGLRVGLRRQRRPDQAAAPVVDHVAAGLARQRLAERTARGRRTDDPPHRPRAERAAGGERLDVADRRPERRETRLLQISTVPNGASSLRQRGGAMGDRGRDALEPHQRDRMPGAPSAAGRRPRRRSAGPGRCAAPDTSNGEPSAAVIARLAARSSRPRSTSVRSLSGLRHHLQRHLGHDRERAPGTRQQLAEVVAGDVLHHLAAGLEAVAEAGHRMRAEQMIARPARPDAARARQPGRRSCRRWFRSPPCRAAAAVSIGSKANCWFLESISDSTSASGAPACTVMISSFGS